MEPPKAPENLISKSKMINILTDAYFKNASRNVSQIARKEKYIPIDSLLYDKYQIDSLQFLKSHNYYTSQLKDYREILEKVEQKLIQKQTKVDSIVAILEYEEELALCDSLVLDSLKLNKKELLKSKTPKLKISKTVKTQDSIK
ncbi:MAG: DUF4296 domain-containing protein [Flavobacteriales bacterium]